MYVIAGLGNPGLRYENTRHNVGFQVIDMLAKEYHIKVKDRKFKALCGAGFIDGEKVLLLKPQTFMNLSGESVAAALYFYHLEPQTKLIVVYDDIDLAPGKLRVRAKGSAGGHNGIKNIILRAKTNEFLRIRIGVGAKPGDGDLVDHVLSRFPKAERLAVRSAEEDALAAIPLMIRGDAEAAMNRFN